jgi:hypothetical protein
VVVAAAAAAGISQAVSFVSVFLQQGVDQDNSVEDGKSWKLAQKLLLLLLLLLLLPAMCHLPNASCCCACPTGASMCHTMLFASNQSVKHTQCHHHRHTCRLTSSMFSRLLGQ